MATEQVEQNLSESFQQGRVSILNTIALVAVLVTLAFVGFYKYRQYLLNEQMASLEQKQIQTKAEIDELKQKSLSEIFVAYQAMQQFRASQILWSRFVKLISAVTPQNVSYSSFGVSTAGNVSISALADSFASVAALIRILESQPAFSAIFIPSVSRARDQAGNELVSFNVVMDYQQVEAQAGTSRKELLEEKSEPSSESQEKTEQLVNDNP